MVIKVTPQMLDRANPVYKCRIMRLIVQGKAEYTDNTNKQPTRH